jgi:hypothetical protein
LAEHVVLWNAEAIHVSCTEVVLTSVVALLGRLTKQLDRLCFILQNALSFGVHDAKNFLRHGIALSRQWLKKVIRFRVVPCL